MVVWVNRKAHTRLGTCTAQGWNIHRAGGPQTALFGSEKQTAERKLVRTKKGR